MLDTLPNTKTLDKPITREEFLAFFTRLAITRCGLDVSCPSCSFSYSVDDYGNYTSSGDCGNPSNCSLID